MIEKLVRFYKFCMLPEMIRGNLKRGLRCVDPDYIMKAQKERESRVKHPKPNIQREAS